MRLLALVLLAPRLAFGQDAPVGEPTGSAPASEAPPSEAPDAPSPPPAAEPASPEVSDFAELTLEDLLTVEVEGVSKRSETLLSAPATVTVLKREDFERFGWRSLSEALATVPGLYGSYGRDYHLTGVRGVSQPLDVNTRVLVLLDGHTLNNGWSASGPLDDLLVLPVEALERVEVIRGPSSSMYGSNAFLAVINVVTRRTSAEPSAAVDLSLASLGRGRAAVRAESQWTPELSLTGYAMALDGPGPALNVQDMTRPRLSSPAPLAAGNQTQGTDGERGINAGATLAYRGLSLTARHAARKKGLPLAPSDSLFDDPYNNLTDEQSSLELRFEQPLAAHSLLARAYYDRFLHHRYLHRDPTDWELGAWTTEDPHTVNEGHVTTSGAELRASLVLHETDTLVMGAEYQRHHVRQPSYELDLATGEPLASTLSGGVAQADGTIAPISRWNTAVYAQNDWRPLSQLGLVLGLRYDYDSIFSSTASAKDLQKTTSPRVAVLWSPSDSASLKLMYGEAFRQPSVFEAFFDDGASVCGNSQVGPERSRTLEAAGLVGVGGGVSLSASLFATRMQSLLRQVQVPECYVGSGPRLQFSNRGRVDGYGADLGVDVRLERQIWGYANLGLWRMREHLDGRERRLPNSPAVVAKAGASVPVYEDKAFVALHVRGMSERLSWRRDPDRAEAAHVVIDAALMTRGLLPGASASLSVINVLDAHYRDPVSSGETVPDAVLQDGLGVILRVGYEL